MNSNLLSDAQLATIRAAAEAAETREAAPQAPAPPKQHQPDGKFAAGNKGGPGNPHGAQVQALRAALFAAVTDKDITTITRQLLRKALTGNITYARELFDRLLGKPSQTIEPEQTEGAIELKWE